MTPLFKLTLLSVIFTIQGCQLLSKNELFAPVQVVEDKENISQNQIYQLFQQGHQYSKLSTEEQKTICSRLAIDYQEFTDWQTGWILVYALNNGFNCLDLNTSLKTLTEIQAQQDPKLPLNWLNNRQIKLFKNLVDANTLQLTNDKLRKSNQTLKKRLMKKELELKELSSKIQALKVIETSINQKTR